MNNQWAKIILFSLLFGVLGFILGRVCAMHCGAGNCGPGGMRGGACAMHGGMGGDACQHGMKGKCCTMEGDSATSHHAMEGHAMGDSTATAH